MSAGSSPPPVLQLITQDTKAELDLLHRQGSAKGAETNQLRDKLETIEKGSAELRRLVETLEKERAALRERAESLSKHSAKQEGLLFDTREMVDHQTKVIEKTRNDNMVLENHLKVK